jgi:SAM-dependent methyltransferase
MGDWSLPREDLSRRARESFRPPPHERALNSAGRIRVALRRLIDLQFGSIWGDLAVLLPNVQGTLADVGSGAQPFRDLLRPDVRYIAVDIAEAEERFGYGSPGNGAAGDRPPHTRYFRGAVLPLDDAEADTVLCTETLEHVADTGPFLRELRRALVPGGELILTVPFAARWHFVPHDYWRYTPAGLKQVLLQAGFSDVRVYARGGALAVAGYKVLSVVVLLLAGRHRRGAAAAGSRLLGLCLLPLAALGVIVGNLGLKYPGTTEDTLGYTVLAHKEGA